MINNDVSVRLTIRRVSRPTMFPPDPDQILSHSRGYDPATETFHTHHDWSDSTPLSHTICTAVAAVSGKEVCSSSVLLDVVDPDALNGLFSGKQDCGDPTDTVSITYEGCVISARRNGHVVVRPLDN